jgi:hypothetical protein
MRIKEIFAKNIPPVKFIAVADLSDIVVFAGPNGVGKTRFMAWLLSMFSNPRSNPDQWLILEATSKNERAEWGQDTIDTRNGEDLNKLRSTLQRNRRRAHVESSVLNFDSDRSITQVRPFEFTWDYQDPFEEIIGWQLGLGTLTNRFQDTVHSIFRKIRSRRESIAVAVERLIRA